MVHLKDVAAIDATTDPVAGPESVPYGAGVIPIEAVLDALALPVAAGAPVCLELGQLGRAAEHELIAASIAWLRTHRGAPEV